MKRMFSLKDRVHGSDTPITFQWQNVLGNYLATTGQDHTVKIWDRHGQLQEEVHLPGATTGIEWDKDGDVLCAICEKSSMLYMWDANQKKVNKIDSGAKDGLTFLCWSKTTLLLAIGTVKGNLILYDHKVGRKVSILGKHNKKIISGVWSLQNKLALSGADNLVTVSDDTGKTIHQFSVRDLPTRIRFSEIKRGGKNEAGDNAVSAIVGKKTLFLYKLFDVENVIELAFQPNYGKIEAYEWYGNGYIMIGFSNGFIIAISTFAKEIGQELFQLRDHHDYLSSIAISTSLNYAASCGDTSVRIHDLHNVTEVSAIINLEDEPKGLKSINWTSDGQLLAVASARGNLHCYLTKLPILGDSYGTKLAYLTSLLEVTVVNNVEDDPATAVSIDIEPTFIACGPYHLAVGMNNRAWFYFLSDKETQRTCDKEYLESIKSMCLNADYAAVLFGGKVQLHMIDQRMHAGVEERETRLFPEREEMGKSTCCALTNDLLVYGTDTGNLFFFYIEDWAQVNVFRHSVGIRNVYPDSCGGYVVFIDEKGDGFIYNPVDDSTFEIPSIPSNSKGLLWEHNLYDKGVFVVFDDTDINTYIFNRESTQGSHVVLVGSTHLPINQKPLLLYNGTVTLQIASGKTTPMLLDTHSFLHVPDSGEEIVINRKKLEQAIALRRWREAWAICAALKTTSKQNWFRLGAAALHALEVDLAVRVYRYLGDAGMVIALESLRDVEDSNLLAGTLASYMGEFDLAQDLLLRSSNPLAALDMRRDLMHWDTALQLANSLDPQQIPFIAKEYGQQLEFTGNYTSALSHFEKGVTRAAVHKEHDEVCAAGVARTSIRLGDIRRGVQLALQHPNRQLKKECGSILEGMRQFQESASLFEKGEYFDKAAAVYIKCKNWQKVGALLPKITSLKIFLQYAKAKEADGKYTEAADAYHRARDYDSEVRIYLDHLRDPERAVHIVKEQGSIEGAKMVAKFFIKHGDYGSAIQFLVLSKCNDEAFQMAQQHGQMEIYADIIGEDASPEDFRSIAVHFENDKNNLLAGKFFTRCGDYPKALRHYLKCSSSDSNEALLMAIEAVAASKDQKLIKQLTDFLMGELDGMPKDANYLFKLYMALGEFGDAAHTAVIISKEEQNNGNYRVAHKLLFSMLQELKSRNIKVPAEMENNLLILHSYILVKDHIKRGNHLIAARMLIRVAENISKFPQHIVPILTTTVIECRRGNLMRSSFSYAAMLMRPEYRNKIDSKFKKKIEDIVRKTGSNQEEEDERTTPCPYCGSELAETDLMCPGCRNTIPYCIATGRHVTRDNLTCCPRCQFPALSSELQRYLDFEAVCPMCIERVTSDELVRIRNPEKIFGDVRA